MLGGAPPCKPIPPLLWKPLGRWQDWLAIAARPGSLRLLLLAGSGVCPSDAGPTISLSLHLALAAVLAASAAALAAMSLPRLAVLQCLAGPGRGGSMLCWVLKTAPPLLLWLLADISGPSCCCASGGGGRRWEVPPLDGGRCCCLLPAPSLLLRALVRLLLWRVLMSPLLLERLLSGPESWNSARKRNCKVPPFVTVCAP